MLGFKSKKKYMIASDKDNAEVGDWVTILDYEPSVEFDNLLAVFEPNLLYYYIVDLEYKYDAELEFTDEENGCPITFKCTKWVITKIWKKTY